MPRHATSAELLTRLAIEQAIEHLLTLLDDMDGDADREDSEVTEAGGDEEPSLGWTLGPLVQGPVPDGGGVDLEEEHDGRESDEGVV